ncbi:MAG TPA: hypothetical protein VF800_02620 [Telluria sp.]|jgi:hypothetical protein
MIPRHWYSLIVRAVEAKDETTINSLAQHLSECAKANEILHAKGYGTLGQGIAAVAAQVPHMMGRE